MKKGDAAREDARLPLLSSAAESLVRGDASHALELDFLSANDAVGRIGASLVELARSLEARGRLLQDVFGRPLSDDDVRKLVESPAGLPLAGERRTLTVLTAEVRGFTALTETLAPDEVVALLGHYLGVMRRVVSGHGGTVDELSGDRLRVLFGAPVSRPDDPDAAVRCAVAMQRSIPTVNEWNKERGIPEIHIGIGLHTGSAIVGGLGPDTRPRYGAAGRTVSFAAHIESYTFGGQILISEATRAAVTEPLEIADELEVEELGVPGPIRLYDVVGIGEPSSRVPDCADPDPGARVSIPVTFAVLTEGKGGRTRQLAGTMIRLSRTGAEIAAADQVRPFSNLKLTVYEAGGRPVPGDIRAKALPSRSDTPKRLTIRFTSVPPEVSVFFAFARGAAGAAR